MNNKKLIPAILLISLGIILVYNYLIAPFFIQPNHQMRMGMHGYYNQNMFESINLSNLNWLIILLSIFGLIWLFIRLFHPNSGEKQCLNCGMVIESERWKVCPRCGTGIQGRGVGL